MNKKERFTFCYKEIMELGYFNTMEIARLTSQLAKIPEDIKTKEFDQLSKVCTAFLNNIFRLAGREVICPQLGQIVKIYDYDSHYNGIVAIMQDGTVWHCRYDNSTGSKQEKYPILYKAYAGVKLPPWTPKNKKVIEQLEELLKKPEYTKSAGELKAMKESSKKRKAAHRNPVTMQTYKSVWPIYYQLKGIKMSGENTWLHCRRERRKMMVQKEKANDAGHTQTAWQFCLIEMGWKKQIYSYELSCSGNYDLGVIIPGNEQSFKDTFTELVMLVKRYWRLLPASEMLEMIICKSWCTTNDYFYNYHMGDDTIKRIDSLVEKCRGMCCNFYLPDLLDYLNGKGGKVDPTVIDVLKDIGAFKEEEILKKEDNSL